MSRNLSRQTQKREVAPRTPAIGPLGAGTALAVADALAATMGRCLGPACGNLLFARDTGDVLLTADGSRTLAALHLEHPVARVVVDCALAHCTVTGDGAKSFVLLLAALLRGASFGLEATAVTSACRGADHEQSSSCRAFAHQLSALQCDVLDGIVSGQMRRHMTLADLASVHDLADYAECIVRTSLTCNLSAAATDALTPAILGLVCPCGADAARFAERVSFAVDNFTGLCTEESGVPVGHSRYVDGVLLHRDFAVRRPGEGFDGAVRFATVARRLWPLSSESHDVTWQYAANAELWRSQLWADRHTEAFVEALAMDGVTVLFSAVKQSDCLLHHARRTGLAVVECIPDEDMALLCEATACEAPTAADGDAGAVLLSGTADFCRRMQLEGGRACIHVGVRRPLRSLVVCAPAQGVASQYAAAASGALKLLLLWSRPVPCQAGPRARSGGPPAGPVAVPAGAILPAGGAFELLLHHFLFKEAVGRDDPTRRACVVLAEALLEIPRRLHRNLLPGSRFLELLSTVNEGLGARGELDGRLLSARGAGGAVEPVAAKLRLVGAAIGCLRKLVRIDAIVVVAGRFPASVRSSRGYDRGDSEDDDNS